MTSKQTYHIVRYEKYNPPGIRALVWWEIHTSTGRTVGKMISYKAAEAAKQLLEAKNV